MITKLRLSKVTEEPKQTFPRGHWPSGDTRAAGKAEALEGTTWGQRIPARPQTGRTARGATCTQEAGVCGRASQGAGKTEGREGG